jgi:RimJ/RimL family protein N-acetyltransferase
VAEPLLGTAVAAKASDWRWSAPRTARCSEWLDGTRPARIITGEGLEIGWGLARHAWGHGCATEAGRAAVDVARRIGAQSVWSFTSVGNERSQAVMRRLGLSRVRYFDHPNIPDGQSTRPHVLYQLDLAGPEPRSEHQCLAR